MQYDLIGSVSVALDWQTFIWTPFAHRVFVDRDVLVAELVQPECIHSCEYTASAITDVVLRTIRPNGCETFGDIFQWQEFQRLRIKQ